MKSCILFFVLLIFTIINIFTLGCMKDMERITHPCDCISMIPDSLGNLCVVNQTNEELLLYIGDEVERRIWNNEDPFIINVQNPTGIAKDLKIYKKFDINDPYYPDTEYLFRRWYVVITNDTEPQNWSFWVIQTEQGDYTESGTLLLNYPLVMENGLDNIYSCDVHLDNMQGAKITSLAPGTENKTVGLKYGLNYIYIHYWNQQGIEDPEYIGWYPENLEVEQFTVILNFDNNLKIVDIPTFTESVGRTGIINITNNLNEDIRIFVSDQPIEYFDVSGRPTIGLSYIEKDDSQWYELEEDRYSIDVANENHTIIYSNFSDCDILELYELDWYINNYTEYQTINITNSTADDDLTIHNNLNEVYLGYKIDSGESRMISIDENILSLKAINWLTTKEIILDPITTTWIITNIPSFILENHLVHTNVNHLFSIRVVTEDVYDLMGCSIKIEFDNNYIEVTEIEPGTFLGSIENGTLSFIASDTNTANSNGWLQISTTRLCPEYPGVEGSGNIAKITFKSISTGITNIVFTDDCIMRDINNEDIIYGGLIGANIDIDE